MSQRTHSASTSDVLSQTQAITTGFPLTRAIQVGKIGSFYYTGLVTVNTSDTTLAVKLGRVPSGYIVVRAQAAGVVQDGSNHGSDWTPSQIVLKASTGGTYGLLVF